MLALILLMSSQACIAAALTLPTWVSSTVDGDVGLFKFCNSLVCYTIMPQNMANKVWMAAGALLIIGYEGRVLGLRVVDPCVKGHPDWHWRYRGLHRCVC